MPFFLEIMTSYGVFGMMMHFLTNTLRLIIQENLGEEMGA